MSRSDESSPSWDESTRVVIAPVDRPVVEVSSARVSGSQSSSSETEGGLAEAEETNAVRFTAAQRAYMNAYYSGGMRGTGKRYKSLIQKAAVDAGLTVAQVKVHACPGTIRLAMLVL